MKRRELIKLSSMALAGLSLTGLTGCSNKSESILDNKNIILKEGKIDNIIPESSKIEITTPMPLNVKLIDDIFEFNKTLKKSKIVSLYTSLPNPLAKKLCTYFNSPRGENYFINSLDKYLDILKYAIDKEFKVIFVLDINYPISVERNNYYNDLSNLFNKLKEIGIKDVKIANTGVIYYIRQNYPEFKIHVSASGEYHSIQMYEYMKELYSNIDSISISTDENYNFEFLYSLRKIVPVMNLELTLNEISCVKYCIQKCKHTTGQQYSGFPCREYMKENPYLTLAKTNLIHPWLISYYNTLGIKNFDITCNFYEMSNISNINYLKYYLECFEKGIENFNANDLIEKIYPDFNKNLNIKFKDDMKLSQLIERLPDIKFFIKNGSKCASNCNINCKYCYKIAQKLKDFNYG